MSILDRRSASKYSKTAAIKKWIGKLGQSTAVNILKCPSQPSNLFCLTKYQPRKTTIRPPENSFADVNIQITPSKP